MPAGRQLHCCRLTAIRDESRRSSRRAAPAPSTTCPTATAAAASAAAASPANRATAAVSRPPSAGWQCATNVDSTSAAAVDSSGCAQLPACRRQQ